MKETREQQLGKAFDRHVSVSAGAGSGKTRVLVERFIHILEHHPGLDISSIVAITFTRKAAAEMMKRVMDAVEDRLQTAIENERMLDVQMWSRIRQHISSARISTIDSFCSQIVREYPLEANVPHTILPLPKSKAVTMRLQCIEDALIHFLDADHPQAALMRSFFHAHHHSTITKALDYLLKKGTLALNTLHSILFQNDDIIIHQAWSMISGELFEKMEILNTTLRDLPGFRDGYIEQELIEQWEQVYIHQQSCMHGTFDENTVHFLTMYASVSKELIGKYVTQKGEQTAKFKKYTDASIDEWLYEYYPIIKQVRKQVEQLCIIGNLGLKYGDHVLFAEKEALGFSRLLLDIALHASTLFETQKRNEGMLEFSDIQSLAMELLNHPEAGPNIRSSIKFLMIDEFQDTNAMQYELASRIVRSLKEGDEDHPVNLYIVGDPKQSIYGFRSADVRVFGMATQDIQQANIKHGNVHQSEDLTEKERHGMLSLSVSFRLLPGIIAFVNDLFAKLMGSKAEGYEVAYEAMIAGRNTSDELLESGELGSITFLIHEEQSNEEEQGMIDEAGLIASAIKDMIVNKSKKIWDSKKDEEGNTIPFLRDVMYKDCTILYERRTMVNILMAALRAEGIPYFTSGNKGFYTSPAIVDITQYLRFLGNPHDDIALASILLSPFFSVSDDTLFAIRLNSGKGSLWNDLNEYVKEYQTDERLLIAHTILTGFREKAQTMSLPILIHSMLEASHWRNIVKTMEDGEQWIANAEKMIGIAREFEQRGFRHIHAFIDELELSAEYDDEPEASIINVENAVNLMTIHASKGLEFPIVFLYDTNVKERSTPPDVHESDQFGIGLPLIAEYLVSGAHKTEQSLLSMAIGMERRARLMSEKKRLLYVALTRAKDHVFISTSFKQGKEYAEGSMMKMIKDYSSAYTCFPLLQDGQYSFETSISIQGRDDAVDISIPVYVQKTVNDASPIDEQEQESIVKPLHLFQKTKQEYKDEWYSISQFMMLESDEQEFRKKYVFGFPNASIDHHAGFINDESHVDINAAQFGIMMHEVLEEIPIWMNPVGISFEQLTHCIDRVIEEYMPHSTEKKILYQRMYALCKAIGESGFMKSNASGILNAKTEYSLTIPIEDNFFCVIYDVMFENEQGELEIWDWKTNACSNQEQVNILTKRYALQMRYYAYVLSLLNPKQQTYTVRLLFTDMLSKSAIDADWTRTLQFDAGDMPQIYNEIKQHIAKAKQSVLL